MKRDLLFGVALLAGLSAQAISSPYGGSTASEGTYYLYQVESGLWLQANRSILDMWATHASLDDVGFDIELRKPDGFNGYQIFCNFTNNGSLNGTDEDRFYLDQANRDVTDWILEPVTVDGVTNAYKIKALATPEGTDGRSMIVKDIYIGAKDGVLSDDPEEFTWQLVSRKERLEKMVAEAANGPVDASWLIPYNDQAGSNDLRKNLWTKAVNNTQGGGDQLNGHIGYPVQEYWHQITMRQQITLTDLPKGTYAFSVQAYYRDTEIESEDLAQRYLDGTENLRVSYFAGAKSAPVMSIFADAKDAEMDGYTYKVEKAGKWVPNSINDASRVMFDGAYVNEYIETPVNDGTLTIGLEKTSADHRDWLIYKRFFLKYVSSNVADEDLSGLQSQLSELITTAESLPQTPSFIPEIAKAKEALQNAKSSTALLAAITDLKTAVEVISSSRDIILAYADTKVLINGLGIDPAEADEIFNTATTKAGYEDAIKHLRFARRAHVAERQADVFKGQPVALGKYYLYNIGRGQFLCGGSDWGAHAALGLPGIEIELEDAGTSDRTGLQKYYIETGLYNGETHHLNYRGYMDAPQTDGFAFIPVDGKENVFFIVQGDYDDVHMAWDPYASTDTGNNDETTVGTECRNLNPNDLNAQWKLVTRAEREALMDKASIDNPVDVTFFMQSPNFNQRENAEGCWNFSDFNIWEYGANHNDFVAESYNKESADLNYMVEGLPAGVYKVSAQGYYRYGEYSHQVNNEPMQAAYLYAGSDTSDDVLLPNITTENGNAPGEGDSLTSEDGETKYHLPNSPVQATNFFKSRLYPVYTVIEKTDDNSLPIGVAKDEKLADGDWVVVDNFRIHYYGNATTKEAVKNSITSGIEDVIINNDVRPEDNRIFNLQGIQVTNPTVPGIYIQNGKKFIVK